MIRTIIFDQDGKLIKTERLNAQSYAKAMIELCSHQVNEGDVIKAFKETVGLSRHPVVQPPVDKINLDEKAKALNDKYQREKFIAFIIIHKDKGKMGANMTTRVLREGHRVVANDIRKIAIQAAEAEGAEGIHTLSEMIGKLATPRSAKVMVPTEQITENTIQSLVEHLSPGDTVIDGGNSNYRDLLRRAEELNRKGIHFIDVGTSGGVWGLTEGYSMMVGGEKEVVE